MIKKITLFISMLFSIPTLASAAPLQALENTQIQLVSQYEAIQPGQPFTVAVLLDHKDGWHSYWENPGDAGIPTSLTWTLPEGFTAGPINWPAPEVLHEGPLVVYAYHDQVFLPVVITPPAEIAVGEVPIKVKAEWLVCKDICIPESAELDITLPVSKDAPALSSAAEQFDAFAEIQPVMLKERGDYRVEAKQLILSIPRAALPVNAIEGAVFLPRRQNLIQYAAEQTFSLDRDTVSLALERAVETPEDEISGLLFVNNAAGRNVFDIRLAHSAAQPLLKNANENPALPLILLFALLGGLVLNLMPCVLPVLSLKALAIAAKAGKPDAHVARQGVAYTLGILLSFALIAGVLIALQQAGEAVGWGYQMQSPAFVGFLIYLLFLVGLNLSGWFELPVLLGNVGDEIAHESSARGSFFTGVLATAVATPCTAPFMASAVGVALTLPAWQAMLVFEALGFGLALPFLLISLSPRLLRFLPKPGAWMERMKKLLAAPMYLSVAWLLWVLMMQTGAVGVAVAIVGMAGVMVLARRRARLAFTGFAIVIILSLPLLSSMEKTGVAMQEGNIAYTPETLAGLRAAGTPVFVDATAAWCITCQLNARVIHSDAVTQAFKQKGITLMIADWTRRDEDISLWLKSFGYAGVPLYVYYPAQGEPVVLPQLLSEEIVLTTIAGK